MTFQQLQLSKNILRSLSEQNYEQPTEIQAKAIPVGLSGRDILGSAQTGTGKTAAFALPIIQNLLERGSGHDARRIRALVVTPTRELALQIGESFTAYAQYTSLRNTVIFGGVPQIAQVQAIERGVDVLIATPGRLLDLMDQGVFTLRDIEFFVLDEADRMLDMGFIHDIRKIIAVLPKKRQSLFFSATMPDNILALSKQILTDPVKIAVDPVSSTADTIRQMLYITNKKSKKDLLLHLLKDPKLDQVLLFSRTKHGADRIVRDLRKRQILCAAIHGDKTQGQRQRALGEFKEGRIRVLVATDIAARGIDIEKLGYVINFDIPNESETYVHRIGRVGRAGEKGIALSLCEPEENAYIRDIEKLIGKKIPLNQDHPFPQTDKPMTKAEKAEFEKEKQRRRQEFFANRNKNKSRKRGFPKKK
jgi:ATP-dependent RNA helicase RhlE